MLTIVVGFLEIHIDDTTRPDISHVLAIDCLDFGKCTRLNSVATVFSEESRDGVVGKFESSLIVARLGV